MQRLHDALLDRLGVAVCVSTGPRYLHSTGQLHKGGPKNGHFIMLRTGAEQDVTLPGERYGFAGLMQAQMLGDLQVLRERGQRVLAIDLDRGSESIRTLARLVAMVTPDRTGP